jgi:hypothetical protein
MEREGEINTFYRDRNGNLVKVSKPSPEELNELLKKAEKEESHRIKSGSTPEPENSDKAI